MALINCTECNHQVSDKAQSCPSCGIDVAAILPGLDLPQEANNQNAEAPPESTPEPAPAASSAPNRTRHHADSGYTTAEVEQGCEFSIRGSGIGLGRIIVTVILGAMLGFIVSGAGDKPGVISIFMLLFAVYAVLLLAYRLTKQRFTINPEHIIINDMPIDLNNVTEVMIENKYLDMDLPEAFRNGQRFVVGGTGMVGASLFVGSAMSNAASAFGADLRRVMIKSKAKRGFSVCVRYGAKVKPLAKHLSETKAISLFKGVLAELDANEAMMQASASEVGQTQVAQPQVSAQTQPSAKQRGTPFLELPLMLIFAGLALFELIDIGLSVLLEFETTQELFFSVSSSLSGLGGWYSVFHLGALALMLLLSIKLSIRTKGLFLVALLLAFVSYLPAEKVVVNALLGNVSMCAFWLGVLGYCKEKEVMSNKGLYLVLAFGGVAIWLIHQQAVSFADKGMILTVLGVAYSALACLGFIKLARFYKQRHIG